MRQQKEVIQMKEIQRVLMENVFIKLLKMEAINLVDEYSL